MLEKYNKLIIYCYFFYLLMTPTVLTFYFYK